MREELRRKLPKTRGWYTGIVVGIIVVVGAVVFIVWHWVLSDNPGRIGNAVIVAARDGDEASMRASLTPASLQNPNADGWLKQFAAALKKSDVRVSDVAIVGDNATVLVAVPHRGGTGTMVTTDVGVKTVRVDGAWKIDLVETMASANPQFWIAVAAEKD
jgi:hypothetical protein